jgi:hypothetical protein
MYPIKIEVGLCEKGRHTEPSTPSMTATTELVLSLASPTDPIEDSHILMILRNMAGQDSYLAVKRTAIVHDVRHHIAQTTWLGFSDVHLVLDYDQLNDLDRIYTIQPLLEAKGNVVDLLVDIQELPPLCFDCPHCGRECNLTECVDWSDDSSERCTHTAHHCCYGQFDAIHEAA